MNSGLICWKAANETNRPRKFFDPLPFDLPLIKIINASQIGRPLHRNGTEILFSLSPYKIGFDLFSFFSSPSDSDIEIGKASTLILDRILSCYTPYT